MNTLELELSPAIEETDCMGHYTKGDPICAKHCLLRLQCAVEREHSLRSEIIEELVASDGELGGKLQ